MLDSWTRISATTHSKSSSTVRDIRTVQSQAWNQAQESPSSDKPPVPGGESFGPQYRATWLPSSQVPEEANDNNIIYFKTPEEDTSQSNLLQLHTLCTKAELDLTLGQLAQQLEDSVESQKVSQIKQNGNKAASSASGHRLQRDMANPLVVDDYYSINDEQVNW